MGATISTSLELEPRKHASIGYSLAATEAKSNIPPRIRGDNRLVLPKLLNQGVSKSSAHLTGGYNSNTRYSIKSRFGGRAKVNIFNTTFYERVVVELQNTQKTKKKVPFPASGSAAVSTASWAGKGETDSCVQP